MGARDGTAKAVGEVIPLFGDHDFAAQELIERLPACSPQAIRSQLHWLVSNGKLVAEPGPIKRSVRYRVQTHDRGFYVSGELIDIMFKIASGRRRAPKRIDPTEATRLKVAEILARLRA